MSDETLSLSDARFVTKDKMAQIERDLGLGGGAATRPRIIAGLGGQGPAEILRGSRWLRS
jgi:hypothetical protein